MRSENESPGQVSRSFTERARREQITRGAIAVLAEQGYGATSLAAIATRLGISKGVISYHFAGKAELLQAVVTQVLDEAAEWMTPKVAGATSYSEALRLYISANLSFLDTHRDDIYALGEVLANARTTEGIPELFGRSQADAVVALEQLFLGGQAAGEFTAFSPRVAAVSLRASIDAVSTLLRAESSFDVAEFERELVSLVERAIGGSK